MRKESMLFILTFFVFFSGFAAANEIYVPDNYPTIQSAIDNASGGDTIIVSPGAYMENIDFLGKAITLRSESGPAFTIIDGGSPSQPDFGSVVLFANGEGNDSVITGFTLTNGTGTFAPSFFSHYCGGAIFCEETSPTIIGNVIRGNNTEYGGGICCSRAAAIPVITGNLIENNSADNGGGIFCRYTTAEIRSNTIRNNSAGFGGGAISCWMNSAPLIVSNVIDANSCGGGGGGGIRAYNTTTPTLINNTFFGNTATAGTGGAVMCKNCTVTIANSIFWNNNAAAGPEIWVGQTSHTAELTISYSDVAGSQASVHVDPGSTLNWNAGMIDADPLFAGADDFHLTLDSPCRDAGDQTVPDLPPGDFEEDTRVAQGSVDIGADEFYYHLYHMGDVIPGHNLLVRVVGPAGSRVMLCLGSGIQDPPQATAYGDIYLQLPVLNARAIGNIPGDGILTLNATVPSAWTSGEDYPFQSLVGQWGKPGTRLTNLMTLCVE